MKGRNERNRLVERYGGDNSRICNYHSGGGWLCRHSAGNFTKRRSQRHAVRSNPFGTERDGELGSVTAEFAIILPSVILILLIGVQVLAIQSNRMKLIGLAAESARALARGEDTAVIEALVAERSMGSKTQVQFMDLSICVAISQNSRIAGLLEIPITERQCARKSGL